MAAREMRYDSPASGFDPFVAEVDGEPIGYDVFIGGEGPPVILMHELDGFKDGVRALADHLVGRGFTVYLPAFFSNVIGAAVQCIRREFVCVISGKTSPVAGWVSELAEAAQRRDPHRSRVGVIGMCLTGGIALASLTGSESVRAAVAAQPAMPWASPAWLFPKGRERDLGLSDDHRSTLEMRLSNGEVSVLPVRFEQDWMCPRARVDEIAALDGADPVHFVKGRGHPTLTLHFRGGGHAPSLAAVDYVADWLGAKMT